jgi:hypothetical protein
LISVSHGYDYVDKSKLNRYVDETVRRGERFIPVPYVNTHEDYERTMDLRASFYKHPYASMVTGVFLFSLLLTGVYFFGLITGEENTRSMFDRLLRITGVLLLATAASWIATLGLSSDITE